MKRDAFTLVELLVVMALIAILATLTIAFFPGAATSDREARAAMTLQGWLNIAKQKALRDQAPRGLRLFVGTATAGAATIPNAVTNCQYLELPDDFSGGSVETGMPVPPPALPPGDTPLNYLRFTGANLFNDYTPADPPAYWAVQPNDTIEVLGSGMMHRITNVGVPNSAGVIDMSHVRIVPPLPYPLIRTQAYRIVRQPRPVGDELKLPDGSIIDVATNTAFAGALNPLPVGSAPNTIDILFAPPGTVLSPVVTDKLHLWVRSPNPDDGVNGTNPFRGSPTLVSIFVRTGAVGAFPPAQTGTDPYVLVR